MFTSLIQKGDIANRTFWATLPDEKIRIRDDALSTVAKLVGLITDEYKVEPFCQKIDITQNLHGTFYCPNRTI